MELKKRDINGCVTLFCDKPDKILECSVCKDFDIVSASDSRKHKKIIWEFFIYAFVKTKVCFVFYLFVFCTFCSQLQIASST